MRERGTIVADLKWVSPHVLALEVLLDIRDQLERHTKEVRDAADRLDGRDRSLTARLRELENRSGRPQR